MAIHAIPDDEIELHEESQDCVCQPSLDIDEESGEMLWIHDCLMLEKVVEEIINP